MRRGTIHTVLVLLTSQSVGRVPASEGQADHDHAHDEHDDGGEDRDEDLRLEPGLDPLGQFLVLVHVARERGDGSYNLFMMITFMVVSGPAHHAHHDYGDDDDEDGGDHGHDKV